MEAALELFFDSISDARIRQMWAKLDAAGVIEPNRGRPHITLALVDGDELDRAAASLDALAEGVSRLRITFESLGIFPGEEPVLFLNPIVNGSLLATHRRIHDAIRSAGSSVLFPQHRPGHWVPHCTLGQIRGAETMPEAVAIANTFRLPIDVSVVALAAVQGIRSET